MLEEALLASTGRPRPVRSHRSAECDVVHSGTRHGPLRVLIVLPSLDQGGAERVSVNLANGLLAAGASPSILLTGSTGVLGGRLDQGVMVHQLSQQRVRSTLPSVIRHVREHRPDVVLSTHTHVNLALCAARALLPRTTRLVLRVPTHAPAVFEGRSTAWSRRAQRLLYRSADLVLATSPTMAADLRTFLTTRVEVLPNPIDEVGIRAGVTAAAAGDGRAEQIGRRFVTVGRLQKVKAVDDLIRAFARGSDPADQLLILGDGPERPTLEALVARLGLSGQVRMPGDRPDPWDEVAAADAFVLASQHEGMPNAVLESLALGTPVIATDDLAVLATLSAQSPDGVVTLVARASLDAAIRRVAAHPASTPIPRPSLLPEENTLAVVTDRLLTLIGLPAISTARQPRQPESLRPLRPLRIVFPTLTPFPSTRASAVQVAHMAQAFAELGHEVTLVVPAPEAGGSAPARPFEQHYGFAAAFDVTVLSRGIHRGQSYLHALRIARDASPRRTDLLFSRNLRACLIPALRGVPTVFEAHTLTSLEGPQERWVLRRLARARGFRGIVAISAALADDVAQQLDVPRERIHVAHDGVRPLPPTPGSTLIRPVRSAGVPLRVGYTGSLYRGRGVELLLDVAERCPWIELHLVGGPEQQAEDISGRRRDDGPATNVVVHGPVSPSEARRLQADFDVLVAPFARTVHTDSGVDSSRWMSPMKVFEYMASGRPIVISDLPVLREVLRPDVDALMVAPEDADALIAALRRLADDPELGARLAASALERAHTQFTWDVRARGILARFVPEAR